MKHSYKDARKIKLVKVNNPFYQLYLNRYRKKKPNDKIFNNVVIAKSATMSYVLEIVIREWVKSSKQSIDETIIEFYSGNKRLFKELDYVLKKNTNSYTIGELKVSSANIFASASKQLIKSLLLLKKISSSVHLQLIHVDLDYKNALDQFDEFKNDFSQSEFRTQTYNTVDINVLHLSAKDVFDWGIAQNIIKTPELLDATTKENELIINKRQINNQIKKYTIELEECKNDKNQDALSRTLDKLQDDLTICNSKIDLSQKGWVHIENINIYNQIVKYFKCKLVDFNTTSEYCTSNHQFEYVSFNNSQNNLTKQVLLMDAFKVYQRLSDSEKKAIENITLDIKNILNSNASTIPIVNNRGQRKIFLDNSLLSNDQKKNKGLIRFKKIINNSEPIEILLSTNNYLIIDNHRILHKTI